MPTRLWLHCCFRWSIISRATVPEKWGYSGFGVRTRARSPTFAGIILTHKTRPSHEPRVSCVFTRRESASTTWKCRTAIGFCFFHVFSHFLYLEWNKYNELYIIIYYIYCISSEKCKSKKCLLDLMSIKPKIVVYYIYIYSCAHKVFWLRDFFIYLYL